MRHALLGSLALLLVACGSSADAPNDDAPSPGSGNDAPPPVATPPSDSPAAPATPAPPASLVVAITAYDTVPEAGVRIVFHDAKGKVTGTAITGADGTVKIDAKDGPAPPMVTALFPGTFRPHAVTWTNVKTGDVLRGRAPRVYEGKTTYTVNAASMPAGATNLNLWVNDGCWGTGTSDIPVDARRGCTTPTGNTIVALANDDVLGPVYAFAKNLPAPAPNTTRPVTLGAFYPREAFKVTVVNKPGSHATPWIDLVELAGTSRHVQDAGTGLERTFAIGAKKDDGLLVRVATMQKSNWHYAIGRVAVAPSATMDLAPSLPKLTGVSIAGGATGRPTLSWTAESSLAGTQGAVVTMRWVTAGQKGRSWTFVVPPDAANVTAPELPADATEWVTPTDANYDLDHRVIVVGGDALASTDAFRQTIADWLANRGDMKWAPELYDIVLPTNGKTLRAVEWTKTAY